MPVSNSFRQNTCAMWRTSQDISVQSGHTAVTMTTENYRERYVIQLTVRLITTGSRQNRVKAVQTEVCSGVLSPLHYSFRGAVRNNRVLSLKTDLILGNGVNPQTIPPPPSLWSQSLQDLETRKPACFVRQIKGRSGLGTIP